MFAVVDIAGQQMKVSPAEKVYVPKISQEIGSSIKYDRVMLVSDDKSVRIGTPILDGVSVEAKVIRHVKDDKVMVFKMKRRKGYRVRRGHRQQYTQVEITNIG